MVDRTSDAGGFDQGCWTIGLIQDLIWREFKVAYSPQYLAEWLRNSYQKAQFISEHLGDVSAEQKKWMPKTWLEILRLAWEKKAKTLFGDESSFAQ